MKLIPPKPAFTGNANNKCASPVSHALCVILALCVVFAAFLPGDSAYAAAGERGERRLNLTEFLSETGMTFSEHLAAVKAYEENGMYPYALGENNLRYAQYRAKHPDMAEGTAIAYVNVRVDLRPYTGIHNVTDPDDVKLLINSHYRLAPDWTPEDLISIGGRYQLREEAAEHFLLMKDAMKAEKLKLHIVSAFRTYEAQERLHKNAVRNRGAEAADLGVARAGHSEHQTGLAVDILHQSHSGRLANAKFEETAEYAWLGENAHKYGFILRYPEEFTETHGYMYEPWHWRYVGEEVATAMYNENISVYEEFYGKYLAPDVLAELIAFYERQVLEAQMARYEAELAAVRQEQAAGEEDGILAAKEIANKEAVALAEAEFDRLEEQAAARSRELELRLSEMAGQEAAGRERAYIFYALLIATAVVLLLLSGTLVVMFIKKGREREED